MEELNVLQMAVLISRKYKYWVFVERQSLEEQRKDPLSIYITVIPFQKMQDAKAVLALYGEKAFMLRTLTDYEAIFDIAQGIPGVKYSVSHPTTGNILKERKSLALLN